MWLYVERYSYFLGAVGPYGVLSLSEARDKAREGLKRLEQGEREPFPSPEPEPESFEAICRKFLLRHVEKEGLRSWKEIERVFEVYILPGWRDRPIESIARRDVTDLLDQVEDVRMEENGVAMSFAFAWLRRCFVRPGSGL